MHPTRVSREELDRLLGTPEKREARRLFIEARRRKPIESRCPWKGESGLADECGKPSKQGLIFCAEHTCTEPGCRYPIGHMSRARPGDPGAVHRGVSFVV